MSSKKITSIRNQLSKTNQSISKKQQAKKPNASIINKLQSKASSLTQTLTKLQIQEANNTFIKFEKEQEREDRKQKKQIKEEMRLLNKEIKKTKDTDKEIKQQMKQIKSEMKLIKSTRKFDFDKQMKITDKLYQANNKPKKNKSTKKQVVEVPKVRDMYSVVMGFYIPKEGNKKVYFNHDIQITNDGTRFTRICSGMDTLDGNGIINFEDYEVDVFYNCLDHSIEFIRKMISYLVSNSQMSSLQAFEISKEVSGFKFTSMLKMNNNVNYELEELDLKADNNKSIYSKYTTYKTNLKAESFQDLIEPDYIDYIKENFIPDSCVYTVIINKFYNKFNTIKSDGKRAYKELTYEYLAEIFNKKLNPQGDNPINLSEAKTLFFERFKFAGLYVYDVYNRCIYKHEPIDKTNSMSLRVILHNKHLYTINDNVKSLQQLTNEIDYSDDQKSSMVVSNKYKIIKNDDKVVKEVQKDENDKEVIVELPKYEEYFCVDYSEILSKIKYVSTQKHLQIVKLIVSLNLDNVLVEFVKSGYTPKCCFHTFLYKISINVDNKIINIECADNNPIYGQQIVFENYQHYKAYDNAYNEVYSTVFKSEHLSEFHPSVKEIENTYKIKPVQGYFSNEKPTQQYDCLDENKAYTQCLKSIKAIPIFSFFDVYEKYNNQPIEPLTYYIIEINSHNIKSEYKLMFQNQFNRVFGFVLDELDELEYKIHYFRKPYRIEEVDYNKPIDELYSNKLISSNFKKNIVNKITGLLEQKKNRSEMTKVFQDYNESNYYRVKYSGRMIPITHCETVKEISEFGDEVQVDKEGKTIYIVNLNKEEDLINGFCPIKDQIYLLQQLKMMRLYKKMKSYGINIIGTKTDCLYYSSLDPIKTEQILTESFEINKQIGGYKIEECKFVPEKYLYIESNELVNIQDFDHPTIKTFTDEYDTKAINEHCNNKTPELVKGLYPGVGKSTLCKNFDSESLFILPYNKLCQNVSIEGFNAITFSKLFGLYGGDKEIKEIKAYDVSDYKTIVFDECYLHEPSRLKRIFHFIQANPNIKVMSTGDSDQRNPIGFYDSAYLTRCMNILFPNQIELSDIKRLTNEEDKKKWKLLKEDILNTKLSIEEICKKHNIKTVRKMDEVDTLINICYFNKARVHRVNEHINTKVLKNNKGFYVGLNVICENRIKTKSQTLHTNYQYKIVKKTSSEITLLDEVDNIEYKITPSMLAGNFRYPYAYTCDSVQGMSFSEKLTIFDSNIPYCDRKFIWTALTRARSLSNVQFYIHSDSEVKMWCSNRIRLYFKLKVQSYKEQDKKKSRTYKDDEYITEEWINKQLETKDYKCCGCQKYLNLEINENSEIISNLTVDRKDNTKAHTMANCQLMCLQCNITKK